MQIPEAVQYFDLGARGVGLVLITWLVVSVRQVRTDVESLRNSVMGRVERLEGLYMQDNHTTKKREDKQ